MAVAAADKIVRGADLQQVGAQIKSALAGKQDVIQSVQVTVDNNTGTPSASGSVSGSTLSLSFQNLKGAQGPKGDTGATGPQGPQGPQGEQGNTGSSVDYPFELANNLTTDDPRVALSAAQGVVLEGEISRLGQKVGVEVNENGWFLVDEALNVAMKYDTNGLDASKVSDHFKSLLGLAAGEFIQVVENGFFFVDSAMNIGVYVDADGIHANNILEYQIVNI